MNRSDAYYVDKYESYEAQFDPVRTDRKARRSRKPKARHTPKKPNGAVVAELVDETAELEGGFTTTYRPSFYEAEWLLSSLRPFYDQALISDVLALVRGGKEASVYRCAAYPGTGETFLAAKVYRPRMFRSLSNDKMYREGREMLTPEGRPVGRQADRVARAVGKKTAYGVQVAHTSWLMYEYTSLERLYQAGAAVPRPFAAAENAILMSYLGDADMPAPTLQEVSLEPDEAALLFREVLRNVELMLQHDLIHGDLSAYNLLYWAGDDAPGKITLIDFPQVVNSRTNPKAHFIFRRDIARVCDYFSRQGVKCHPAAIAEELWYRYGAPTFDDPAADGD